MATTRIGGTRRTKRESWSYKAGERGTNRVRAYEEPATGRVFIEYYDRDFGAAVAKRKRVAVPDNDRNAAKRMADEAALKLRTDADQPRSPEVTLHALFDNYLRETAGQKGASKREHDERAAEMFLRYYGPQMKAKDLNRRHWDRFITARRRGEIAPRHARGMRAVGERVIAYDLTWLRGVLTWATVSGADGCEGVLLERNPLRGLPMPRNENPKRTALTEAQYRAMLAVSDEVGAAFRLALVVAHETGHRIGSIRQLRWSDVDFEADSIHWRGENDKMENEHGTPMETDALRDALRTAQAAQQAIGEAWVFPAPGDPTEPCSRHLVRDWWERGAVKAKLPKGERYGWHSLRRKFATDMEGTDLRTLQDLGGWKSHHTILRCYQRPDENRQRAALAARQQRRATG